MRKARCVFIGRDNINEQDARMTTLCTLLGRAIAVLFLLTGCLFQSLALAAQDIVWDLGKNPTVSSPAAPGDYRVRIRGQVLGANYNFQVVIETLPTAGLTQPGKVADPFAGKKALLAADDPCATIIGELQALHDVARTAFEQPALDKPTAEERFYVERQRYESHYDSLFSACRTHQEVTEIAARYHALLAASESDLGTYSVERGQQLIIKVSRAMGTGRREFVYEANTGKRGTWISSWGIGVIPNNDEKYFSRQLATDSFEIARKRDNGGYDPTAGVFYTWLPVEREASDWNAGIAAGIGLDKNNLALFLGAHVTFNQNVGLVTGVALHQESRLRGEFERGQIVSTPLTSDALEERVSEVAWFVALTLRFAGE